MHHSHAIGWWAVSCDSCFLFLSPWLNLDWQGQCLPGAWKWGGIFFFSAARAMMWILIRLAALLYGSAAIAVIAVAAAAAMSPEREVSLTSWHFSTGATQIQEGGEGASGWGSAVCCRAGSRPRPSVPGAASLWVTHHLNCQGGKLSGLSPTWDFLLCRCCRGLKSWSTSGSRMTSGPLLFARPSSCSGPPCWRARCFWGDSIEKK